MAGATCKIWGDGARPFFVGIQNLRRHERAEVRDIESGDTWSRCTLLFWRKTVAEVIVVLQEAGYTRSMVPDVWELHG